MSVGRFMFRKDVFWRVPNQFFFVGDDVRRLISNLDFQLSTFMSPAIRHQPWGKTQGRRERGDTPGKKFSATLCGLRVSAFGFSSVFYPLNVESSSSPVACPL
jgi:hypothetical protein